MFIRDVVDMKALCIFPSRMVSFTFHCRHLEEACNSANLGNGPCRKNLLVIWFWTAKEGFHYEMQKESKYLILILSLPKEEVGHPGIQM